MRSRRIAVAVFSVMFVTGIAAAAPPPKPGMVKVYKRKAAEKKPATTQNKPSVKIDILERKFKKQADAAREAAIQTLIQLIEVTPKEDAQKPVMLFKLADLYWEKSNTYFVQAYAKDDLIHDAKVRKDLDTARRHLQAKFKLKKKSDEWRKKVVDVYQVIEKDHPDYTRLDAVYYYIGYHMTQMGLVDQGYKYFLKLVRQRPKSKLVPEALLSIGEYYFNNRDLDLAAGFYQKVQLYPSSKAYGFALYKHGWVFYNKRQWMLALKKFLQVIRYADTQRVLRKKDRLVLRREAIRDLVKTYAQTSFGADNALPFFKKIAPKIYLELGQMLAVNYFDNGKYGNAVRVYKHLIRNAPSDKRALVWQREIVNNTDRLPNQEELTVKEVGRMVALYQHFKGKVDENFLKDQEPKIDELMRVIASHYHKNAEVTKSDKTMAYAHHMYKEYFKIFSHSPELAAMMMNYGHMLYGLNNFKLAVEMYEKVLESAPDGKYAEKAAFFAVACYNKLVTISYRFDKELIEKKRPLPDVLKKMVSACDRYVVTAKKKGQGQSEDVVKCVFATGRIYFQHYHLDEAVTRFERIKDEHRTHHLLNEALRYLAVLYVHTKKQDKFQQLQKGIQTMPIDPSVRNTLRDLAKNQQFNRCFDLEKTRRFASAGLCFRRYTDQFPDSKILDQALYKAAQNFHKSKMVPQAIKALGELYNKRGNSKLAPDTLFAIGQMYHSVAVYSEAARFYEIAVLKHGNHKKAEDALLYAATFRQGLKEYDKAIEDYKRYLELFKSSNKVARVYFNIGLLMERQKQWRAMGDHFERYMRAYRTKGSADMALTAMFKIGLAQWEQGRHKKALKQFKQVQAYYERLAPEDQKKLNLGLTSAAHARFFEGEYLLRDANRVTLHGNQRKINRSFLKKGKIILEAKRIFQDVRKYKDPNWTIASICRMGAAYQRFGDAIEKIPDPRGLGEDGLDKYKAYMDKISGGVKKNAIRAYKQCLQLAIKLSWFNKYTSDAELNLGKLDYSFKYMKELRPRPSFVRTRAKLADFDMTLPD